MAVTSGSCFSFSTLTKLMVTESEDREEWREGVEGGTVVIPVLMEGLWTFENVKGGGAGGEDNDQ